MPRLSSDNVLLLLTVIGVGAGIILGVSLWDPAGGWSKRQLSYLRFPGEIFVRMLKMLILPLIVSSIMYVHFVEYFLFARIIAV
jgi:Na+/H+-dicarboxylate symporter